MGNQKSADTRTACEVSRTLKDKSGFLYSWTRQQRGRVFGLKAHASPGFTITHWVSRDKNGYWEIDGLKMDGVVWGAHRSAKAARMAVAKRLGLEVA